MIAFFVCYDSVCDVALYGLVELEIEVFQAVGNVFVVGVCVCEFKDVFVLNGVSCNNLFVFLGYSVRSKGEYICRKDNSVIVLAF